MKDQINQIPQNENENADKPSKPKRSYEISLESQEERQLLVAFLLDQRNELIQEQKERRQQIESEKIELRSGRIISRLEIKQFVTSLKQPYTARFPNDNPFFTHMFRLHPKLIKYDPNKFEKPYLAGKLLKQLTYDRFRNEFSTEVLPTLIVLAMPGGVRLYKCHEFLTPEGTVHFTRFIEEANKMMEKYRDLQWYDVKKEYSSKYKLPFQPRLF